MKRHFLAGAVLVLHLTGCSTSTVQVEQPTSTPDPKPEPEPAVVRPFPDDSFHELLVAEFAVRRQHYELALGTYIDQAEQTRDTGVAARATRLSQFLKSDKAALKSSNLWVDLDPDNLEARFTLATQLAKQRQPAAALEHMEVVLRNGGRTNFAIIAASTAKLDEATQQATFAAIHQLSLEFPDNSQLLIAKAMMLHQQGKNHRALANIQQALEKDSNSLHAIILEARLLQQMGREQEAFTRIEQVLETYPQNRRLRLQYARMLMNQDLDAARAQFEILLQAKPNDPDLLLTLGLICKETGAIEDSKDFFTRLINTEKYPSQAQFYLGQLAELQEQWEIALHHYQQVGPGNQFMKAINRITVIYLQQDKLIAARSYLGKLREQHPSLVRNLYMLESELLMTAEYYQSGYDLLSEALLAEPNDDSLLYARSMFSEKLGAIDLVEQDLRAMLDNNPNNPLALNALGYSLTNHSDRYEEARDLISKALKLKPNDPAILDSLGWVEFRLGRHQRALEILEEAYEKFPDHEVAAHLGEVLWVTGNRDQAQRIWREGLERNPNSPYIHETMQRLTGSDK